MHFKAKHSAVYEQMSTDAKKARIAALLSSRTQKSMLTTPTESSQKATLASWKIVY